jgi:hypothetical protein
MRRDRLRDALNALVGQRMDGGCEHCTAQQVLRKRNSSVYVIETEHATWCPQSR